MLELSTVFQILTTVGIGALIGVERERGNQLGEAHFAGIRTFILVALLGHVSSTLGAMISPLVLLGMCFAVTALCVTAYIDATKRGDHGVTTEVAFLLTFALGVLVHHGEPMLATALAVIITVILSLKLHMHTFAWHLTEDDLFAIVKFVVAAALILPLLPNTPIDPTGVFIPRQFGLTVVLVLAFNFAGYFLSKFWDPQRSTYVTAFLGGLVSSTMVTWTLSGRSSEHPTKEREYALATLLAILVMLPRIGLLAVAINAAFASFLLGSLVAILVPGLITFSLLKRGEKKSKQSEQQLALGNPFELLEAAKFGALYLIIVYAVHYARATLGDTGVYVASALAGLVDLDAITLSLSRLTPSTVSSSTAASAILLALNVNNGLKLLFVLARGSNGYRRLAGGALAVVLITGITVQYLAHA